MVRRAGVEGGGAARRARIIRGLGAIVGAGSLITGRDELRVYECDGLTAHRALPLAVVLPAGRAELRAVLALCRDMGVKIVPRGAGTSLSGGAIPTPDGIVIAMTRFNRILEIDLGNRCAVVEPGVTNLAVSEAVAEAGFYYAPDPSSQIVCTIGGNVAENAGGIHCLKYGLTSNNLLGLEMVLMNGDVLRLGGKRLDSAGYDLAGLIAGSEGLLGFITEVSLRILPRPPLARALLLGFDRLEDAGACVEAIIAAGIIPAGLEMMDGQAVAAAEAFCQPGYPTNIAALLIVELDGPGAEVDHLAGRVKVIAKATGCTTARLSRDEAERQRFWAGRKAAFPAVGRLAPDYYCMDGTIPRRRMAEVLARIGELSARFGLRVANVFHAGDGNLHPLILYDANRPGELARAEEFGSEILRLCVEVGGVLSGEHGIGVEKRHLMEEVFSKQDLDQQQRVKCAFDPDSLLNPDKVFPVLHRCAELGRLHVHGNKTRFPDLARL